MPGRAVVKTKSTWERQVTGSSVRDEQLRPGKSFAIAASLLYDTPLQGQRRAPIPGGEVIDAGIITVSSAIVFVAFVVLGLTGFGSALVMVPFLMLYLDPKLVVPTSRIIGSGASVYLAFRLFRLSKKQLLLALVAGNFAGTIVGTYGLVTLQSDVIRSVFAVLVAIFALQILLERREPGKRKLPGLLGVAAGGAGGVAGSLFGTGGPPVVFYLDRVTSGKSEFRATISVYFAITTLWGLGAYAYAGLFTREVLLFVVWLIPSVGVGTLVGYLLHEKVDRNIFRRIVALILLATSVCLLLT
jgi:uncharacterized membrane protein YfcA